MVLVAPLHYVTLLALAHIGIVVASHSSHCELAPGIAHITYGAMVTFPRSALAMAPTHMAHKTPITHLCYAIALAPNHTTPLGMLLEEY